MTEDHCVRNRQYSECSRRASDALRRPVIHAEDVLYALAALPQPQNTRRVGVIPEGESFVYSQAAGLTTQRNKIPTLSNICSKCPNLVHLLARFALEHDKDFRFTTITINYNYAAAPHRDVNHEDGRARIIALGTFSGGGLKVETLDDDIDIKNKWFDFDGRLLHSTNPFKGERYSLVYFTHTAWTSAAVNLARKLVSLSVPWPTDDRLNDVVCSDPSLIPINTTGPDYGDDIVSSTEPRASDYNALTSLEGIRRVVYFFLPDRARPQYQSFVLAEVSSLASMAGLHLVPYYTIDSLDSEVENVADVSVSVGERSQFPPAYSFTEPSDRQSVHTGSEDSSELDESHSARLQQLVSRAVSFTTWRVVCHCNKLGNLRAALSASPSRQLPDSFSIDVVAFGRKLSTRQKRNIMLQANLGRSKRTYSRQSRVHRQFSLLLRFDVCKSDKLGMSDLLDGLNELWLCEEVSGSHSDDSLSVDAIAKKSAVEPDDQLGTCSNCTTVEEDEFGVLTRADDDKNHEVTVQDFECSIDSVSTTNDSSVAWKAPISVPSSRPSATPLKPMLTLLLSNLAKVCSGSLVLDLCAGSGSLLKPTAATKGSIGIACDVSIDDNFASKPSSNFVLANLYHGQIHGDGVFDAVIVDPPYGRREKHVDAAGVSVGQHSSNEERALDRFKVLKPILATAQRVLRPGGRLVFLFFNYPQSTECAWDASTVLPEMLHSSTIEPDTNAMSSSHVPPTLRLLHTCREQWSFQSGHVLARDVCVLEKC